MQATPLPLLNEIICGPSLIPKNPMCSKSLCYCFNTTCQFSNSTRTYKKLLKFLLYIVYLSKQINQAKSCIFKKKSIKNVQVYLVPTTK